MNILEVEGLCKTYPAFALRDVSFAVEPGTIMGFIGRNGAGKSTTIKSMLNLVHPDSGRVTMFGQDFYANEPACKQQLGVVLGGVDFYPNKKLRSITNVTRTFYDRWDEDKYRHYLQLFALDETKKVSQLSSGMRVKYMLALALSHDARLLGIFFTFLNGRENKDVYYCAVLPVTKRDQVRARAWLVVAVELAELVIAVPFAFLSARINPNGTNLAGIDANVALFGCVLLIYGVFNVVFLPVFYKTAIRAGRAFLLAVIPMTVLMVLVEALSHFPVVGPYLDATDAAGQVRQLPVLAVGLAAFALLSWLAYRKAAKNYERVDL